MVNPKVASPGTPFMATKLQMMDGFALVESGWYGCLTIYSKIMKYKGSGAGGSLHCGITAHQSPASYSLRCNLFSASPSFHTFCPPLYTFIYNFNINTI